MILAFKRVRLSLSFSMIIANILFYFFSILLVLSSLLVVLSQHPIFSLIFLVSSFLLSSFLLFLLECEFLALLFIIIYVGAIAVLFLFAVMMIDLKQESLKKNITSYLPVGFFFALFMLFPIIDKTRSEFNNYSSESFYFNKYRNWYDLIDSTNDIEVYGQVLYTYFVLQFLVAGLILLVVLIGVVYLTNTHNSKDSKEQSDFKQLSRNSKFFFKDVSQ